MFAHACQWNAPQPPSHPYFCITVTAWGAGVGQRNYAWKCLTDILSGGVIYLRFTFPNTSVPQAYSLFKVSTSSTPCNSSFEDLSSNNDSRRQLPKRESALLLHCLASRKKLHYARHGEILPFVSCFIAVCFYGRPDSQRCGTGRIIVSKIFSFKFLHSFVSFQHTEREVFFKLYSLSPLGHGKVDI